MYREMVKSKTAAKSITYKGLGLKDLVLKTLKEASDLVGSTLGPNGKLVLIERQENLEPFTTKDGITVFNSMAFSNPTKQAVLEAARSSSSKTNVEAGDGTTTATILAEALIRLGFEHLEKNPRLSTQKVMRELEGAFKDVIAPFIKATAVKITEDNNNDLLTKVAMIATNSDEEMAEAVVHAFSLVGHNGEITIDEVPGSFGFKVEKIEGLPIARGFEDTGGRFIEEFINDKANYRIVVDKPRFILYDGKLNEPSVLIPVLQKVAEQTRGVEDDVMNGDVVNKSASPNVVVVAHHFSESVLHFMANNCKNREALNIIPLKTVMTQQTNSPHHFLYDLSAFTGAEVFNPLNRPLERAEIDQLGLPTMNKFESYRYRSVIMGMPEEPFLLPRVEELEQQAKQAESQLDAELTRERMALLTGGVARIKVMGSSDSELKEKKHRVEDAVMAIKGALREGVLPGCGKTLLTLAQGVRSHPGLSEAVKTILGGALSAPFARIFENGEIHKDEIQQIYEEMMEKSKPLFYTYDALNNKYGDGIELGVIDSASAVLMSVKNSLSVAKMLMGLSGIVVFQRDLETEVGESKSFAAQQKAIDEAIKARDNEKWEQPGF